MTILGPAAITPTANRASTSFVGAASELVACAELMRLGFSVFRCESPTAPFDLVAYADGQCLRVEVKTLSFQASYAPIVSVPVNDEWDLVAYVGRGSDVFLFEPQPSNEDLRRVVHEAVRSHYGYAARSATLRPCGTVAAYSRHIRADEAPCEPCRAAMRSRPRKAHAAGRLGLSGGAA